jgi:hypothetical protein
MTFTAPLPADLEAVAMAAPPELRDSIFARESRRNRTAVRD